MCFDLAQLHPGDYILRNNIIFLDYMKQILTLEAFNHSSIFNKSVFCLVEKKGMLVNDECSLWYN